MIKTDKNFGGVKSALITEGINELEEHGLTDFSLRRVATACNVSCAAPYKHFKNKNDFILEIIKYIAASWKMLETQVKEIYSENKSEQISESVAAFIKFWITNPNYRAILFLNQKQMDAAQKKARDEIDDGIKKAVYDFDPKNAEMNIYKIRSLTYGAILMIENGDMENTAENMNSVKKVIYTLLENSG